MGRQENIEIFEDTQRMYKTNVRLIEAIKRSAKEQQLFKSDCQITEERGGRTVRLFLARNKQSGRREDCMHCECRKHYCNFEQKNVSKCIKTTNSQKTQNFLFPKGKYVV